MVNDMIYSIFGYKFEAFFLFKGILKLLNSVALLLARIDGVILEGVAALRLVGQRNYRYRNRYRRSKLR